MMSGGPDIVTILLLVVPMPLVLLVAVITFLIERKDQ